MTKGTKIFLAVFAGLIGVLVLYYGVLMPGGEPTPALSAAAQGTPALRAGSGIPASESGTTPPPAAAAKDNPASAAPGPATGLLTQAVQNTLGSHPRTASDPNVAADPNHPATGSENPPPAPLLANHGATIDGETPAAQPKPTAAPPKTVEYVVQNGDTMSSIAEDWFGDRNKWSLVAKENPLVDPNHLQIGQRLRLPPKDAKPQAVKNPPAEPPATDKSTYIVRSGDTLAKIAREKYGDVSKWEAIYTANKAVIGSDPANLRPGMKLTLPAGTKKPG